MAKVSTVSFHAESPVAKISVRADVTVDSTGVFKVTMPEEYAKDLVEAAHRLREIDRNGPPNLRRWQEIEIEYVGVKRRLASKTLKVLDEFVRAIAKDYVACEIKDELAILYGSNITAHFFLGKNGVIYPNGAYASIAKVEGEWGGSEAKSGGYFSDDHHGEYKVGFAARVVTKRTYVRLSGSKTAYLDEDGVESHHGTDQSWRAKLDAFNHMSVLGRSIMTRHEAGFDKASNMREVPYTEEAAKFFYEVVIGICALANRIDTFFKDDKRLIEAISSGQKLLGGPDDDKG